MTIPTLATIYAFIVGLCVGSFLNVCVARWPRELSVVRPRSRCPHCGHQLAWFENIPVASWLVLRARCRCCDEPISAIYPMGELVDRPALGARASRTSARRFTALRLAVFLTILTASPLRTCVTTSSRTGSRSPGCSSRWPQRSSRPS